LVLNKYPEVFHRFYESLVSSDPGYGRLLVVTDNHDGSDLGPGNYEVLASYGPFVFSKNVNLGLNYLAPEDVIFCNDDISFPEKGTLSKLAGYARARTNVGITAPLVDGGVGNPYQDYNQRETYWRLDQIEGTVTGRTSTSKPVCFICVYIKRKMIDEIGLLDESFTGYGLDDNDYCIRARRAEWRTTITSLCHVKHGDGGSDAVRGLNWHQTYSRNPNLKSNLEIFQNKYRGKEIA
jgi:GT2 family glycosyltransferase